MIKLPREDAWPHSRSQYRTWQFLSSLSVLAAALGRSRREPSVVPAQTRRAGRGFPHARSRAPLAFGDRSAPDVPQETTRPDIAYCSGQTPPGTNLIIWREKRLERKITLRTGPVLRGFRSRCRRGVFWTGRVCIWGIPRRVILPHGRRVCRLAYRFQ